MLLTSRDIGRGTSTAEELKKQQFKPKYHQLDLGGVANLIPWRGAGSIELFGEHAKTTLNTNLFNTLRTFNTLFPIYCRAHARVFNLTSFLEHLIMIKGQDEAAVALREKLESEGQLVEVLQNFVE